MKEQFSISDLLDIVLPKWIFILVCTILFGASTFLASQFLITPMYTASGTLYVTGDLYATEAQKHETNLSDLMLSQELAKTYGQILSSNTFYKRVASESGLGYTFSDIKRMTTITNVEETGILRINITNSRPEHAYLLTNTILKQAPSEIERVVVSGQATIIDPAEMPVRPSSPSIPKNTVFGLAAGFILALASVFLMDMLDSTIKSGEDVEKNFGLPILGIIPAIEPRSDSYRNQSGAISVKS